VARAGRALVDRPLAGTGNYEEAPMADNARSKARNDREPTTPDGAGPPNAQERHLGEALHARVAEQVLHALEVQVRPLWNEHYRVNVLVGANAACARIAHSYFVVADSDGKVLRMTPAVNRC
jgi:hypothetical protein